MNIVTIPEDRRRFLIRSPPGGIVAPVVLMENALQGGKPPPFEVRLAPKFYPKVYFVPEINVAGKMAIGGLGRLVVMVQLCKVECVRCGSNLGTSSTRPPCEQVAIATILAPRGSCSTKWVDLRRSLSAT